MTEQTREYGLRCYLFIQGVLSALAAGIAAALARPRARMAVVGGRGRPGVELVEIAIAVAGIALLAAVGVRFFGEGIGNYFRTLLQQVTGGGGGGAP